MLLSKGSQSEKARDCMIPNKYHFANDKIIKIVKIPMVARGGGKKDELVKQRIFKIMKLFCMISDDGYM